MRPIDPAEKDAAVLVLGGREALDTPENRILVHTDGPAAGVAVWQLPSAGALPQMGAVVVPRGAPATRMFALAAACAQQMIDAGFPRGRFRILDATLLRLLTSTFKIAPVVEGIDTRTGAPASWTVDVDLADAIAQVKAAL